MYSTFPTIKHETEATRAARGEVELPEETPAEEVLRSLACSLSAGGYNAPTVDAKLFEEKIRWGIDNAVKEAVSMERERCAKICESKSAGYWSQMFAAAIRQG